MNAPGFRNLNRIDEIPAYSKFSDQIFCHLPAIDGRWSMHEINHAIPSGGYG